jgi:hypothetical protein
MTREALARRSAARSMRDSARYRTGLSKAFALDEYRRYYSLSMFLHAVADIHEAAQGVSRELRQGIEEFDATTAHEKKMERAEDQEAAARNRR